MSISDLLFAHLVWQSSPLTIGEHLEQLQRYVACLAEVSDAFSALHITGAPKASPLIRPGDADFVDRMIPFAYSPGYRHDGLDARGKPTRDTTSRYGTTIALQTPGSYSKCISLSIDGGATEGTGDAYAHVYFPAVGDLADLELAEAIFRASVAFWAPAWGWLTRLSLGRLEDRVRVGWRTYLGVPSMIGRLPRGVLLERVPPGGALVSLHGDTFDPSDPAQFAEARSILESVAPAEATRGGKIKTPPDSEIIGRGLRIN